MSSALRREHGEGRRQSGVVALSVALAVVGLMAVAAGVWYFVFRDTSPPAVSHEAATRSLDNRAASATTPTSAGAPSIAPAASAWKVDTTIGSFRDFTSAWAGY